MTIPVSILASLIAASAAILIALVGAWGLINSRLGKLESGQETLAAEIRASRERTDMQFAAVDRQFAAIDRQFAGIDMKFGAAEERALAREAAVEERALAREAAAEERALARHNELLAEIRLWRAHGHDADGTIFFRVPE